MPEYPIDELDDEPDNATVWDIVQRFIYLSQTNLGISCPAVSIYYTDVNGSPVSVCRVIFLKEIYQMSGGFEIRKKILLGYVVIVGIDIICTIIIDYIIDADLVISIFLLSTL